MKKLLTSFFVLSALLSVSFSQNGFDREPQSFGPLCMLDGTNRFDRIITIKDDGLGGMLVFTNDFVPGTGEAYSPTGTVTTCPDVTGGGISAGWVCSASLGPLHRHVTGEGAIVYLDTLDQLLATNPTDIVECSTYLHESCELLPDGSIAPWRVWIPNDVASAAEAPVSNVTITTSWNNVSNPSNFPPVGAPFCFIGLSPGESNSLAGSAVYVYTYDTPVTAGGFLYAAGAILHTPGGNWQLFYYNYTPTLATLGGFHNVQALIGSNTDPLDPTFLAAGSQAWFAGDPGQCVSAAEQAYTYSNGAWVAYTPQGEIVDCDPGFTKAIVCDVTRGEIWCISYFNGAKEFRSLDMETVISNVVPVGCDYFQPACDLDVEGNILARIFVPTDLAAGTGGATCAGGLIVEAGPDYNFQPPLYGQAPLGCWLPVGTYNGKTLYKAENNDFWLGFDIDFGANTWTIDTNDTPTANNVYDQYIMQPFGAAPTNDPPISIPDLAFYGPNSWSPLTSIVVSAAAAAPTGQLNIAEAYTYSNGVWVAYTPQGSIADCASAAAVNSSAFSFDAASRLEVSESISLGDYNLAVDNLTNYFDQATIGTGTQLYSSVNNAQVLATPANGDVAVFQTFQRHPYHPGHAQQAEFTFFGFEPQTGVVKRVGYFSSSTNAPYDAVLDGIFLESSAGTVKLVIAKDGATVVIEQADWLIPTGIDWSDFQIALIDFLYLGGSSVKLYMIYGGQKRLMVRYDHANVVPSAILGHPAQPIRASIRSTGGGGTMAFVCANVGTLGTTGNNFGNPASVDTGQALIAGINTLGTEYAILGIRKSIAPVEFFPAEVDVTSSGGATALYRWRLRINPAVTGTFTYSAVPGLYLESAVGSSTTTTSGGVIIAQGSGSARAGTSGKISEALRIGQSIAGVNDELVLTVTPLNGTHSISASISGVTFR